VVEKEQRLRRTAQLLAEGGQHALRYAALELRLCIEDITYAKLRASKKHLPPEVLQKWQPPQAMRALMEFEPFADQDFKFYMSAPASTAGKLDRWVQIGEHKTLGLSWLSKNYHKIGRMLHGGPGSPLDDEVEAKEYLTDVLGHIRLIVAANLEGLSMLDPIRFECEKCRDVIVVAKHKLQRTKEFSCLNPNCRAEYEVSFDGEGNALACLKCLDFPCSECKATTSVEARLIKPGFKFECKKCRAKHVVVAPGWHFQRDEASGGS